MRFVFPLVLALALSGCVARTAWNVATLPVRAGSQMVDWTTTSRDEADRNAGRKMRRQHKREDKANRNWEREEARRQREAMDR